jgi:predicted DNA-binding protein (UPF0251 family)
MQQDRRKPIRPRGRPRVPDAQKRVQISVTLSPEALRLIDVLTRKRKENRSKRATRSRVVADAVDAGLMKLASDVLAEITKPTRRRKKALASEV